MPGANRDTTHSHLYKENGLGRPSPSSVSNENQQESHDSTESKPQTLSVHHQSLVTRSVGLQATGALALLPLSLWS